MRTSLYKYCKRCDKVKMPNNHVKLCTDCRYDVKIENMNKQTANRRGLKISADTIINPMFLVRGPISRASRRSNLC